MWRTPGSQPHGIAFAGGKVYFTAEGYMLVGRYDPVSNKIDWMLGTGQARGHMIAVTKDLKRIYTANSDSDTVSVVEPWSRPANYEKDRPDDPARIVSGKPSPDPSWMTTAILVGKQANAERKRWAQPRVPLRSFFEAGAGNRN